MSQDHSFALGVLAGVLGTIAVPVVTAMVVASRLKKAVAEGVLDTEQDHNDSAISST